MRNETLSNCQKKKQSTFKPCEYKWSNHCFGRMKHEVLELLNKRVFFQRIAAAQEQVRQLPDQYFIENKGKFNPKGFEWAIARAHSDIMSRSTNA